MNNRFSINEIHICTFDNPYDKKFKPNLNTFPTRWCVIDKDNNIAIDINMNLKYEYLPTISGLYIASGASKLIKENKRMAVIPYTSLLIPDEIIEKSEKIIELLKSDYDFLDGNEVYDNETYLKKIEEENKVDLKNENPKILKKRFKK